MQSHSVAAVVVTYNRPYDLKACIAALQAQTFPLQSIIVLDNGGPVPAADILAKHPRLNIIRSEKNLGGAGGFAAGLQAALKQNVDWVWLLDDDAISDFDALEQLLLTGSGCKDCGALLSAVYEFSEIALRHRRHFESYTGLEWSISRKSYDRRLIQVDTGSFVGFLVRAEVARSMPGPNEDYFLAFDDTEYSLRVRDRGHALYLVPSSRINHLRSSDSRLRQGPFGGKHFLNVRNHMFVKMRYARIKPVACFLASLYGFSIWLRSGGWKKPSSLRLLIQALSDGFLGHLGPPPNLRIN